MDEFYRKLFTESSYWSTPFPNYDESSRWAKICKFLSIIAHGKINSSASQPRILDVGCGRGWLTNLANIYGSCDGIDITEDSVELAKRSYPKLTFYLGDLLSLKHNPEFRPYDVIIVSEVIEHVEDKCRFIDDIKENIAPGGSVIITTPRGEVFKKWLRLGNEKQPIEQWITEKELKSSFQSRQFHPVDYDRVYLDLPGMSFLHRLCASRKFSGFLSTIGMRWVLKGMQFSASIYQVWHFQLRQN